IHKDGDGDASFQLKSDSLPHAHAHSTKTFYKHQDSRIMKAQELKTKTSAQTLIYKIFLQRYQVYQGRLLASFQDDAKYEHVGQDTRSQGTDGVVETDGGGRVVAVAIKRDSCIGVRTVGSEITDTGTLRMDRDWVCGTSDWILTSNNDLISASVVSLAVLTKEESEESLRNLSPKPEDTWTRFLGNKTEAFKEFKIFSKMIQNTLGCSIVSIKTDHGREFDNEVQFGNYCELNGISYNFFAPCTPQSNGVVERKNRTLQKIIKESLNVTFDETHPPPKTSPLEDDDLVEEEAIEVNKTRP
ncbi:retrovirus-related pol polyprotein from transposon TNT 1-94, partial [Tanacetum coccineum]